MQRCGACSACRAGLDNHCAYLHPDDPSVRPAGPRGFSNRIVVPPYKAFPVPPHLPAEAAALAEPVACVLRSVRQGSPRAGETAVVVGAGTMGLLHAVLLLLHGCRVLILGDNLSVPSLITEAGARVAAFAALSEPVQLRALIGGDEPDMIFCTRHGAEGIRKAVGAVARGGRVILYQSIRGDDSLTIPSNLLHYREIKLIGTIAQSMRDMADAIELLAMHTILFSCLRLEVTPMSLLPDAFEQALSPEVHRVLLDFRE
jgi:L-iditol 2-dehydrogenase